jgi:hypothetical protein
MSNAVFAGDTSGSITIQAPAVAGTNTLTLPAATGTLALTSQIPSVVSGPVFNAYQSSAQTVSSNTQTLIQFQTKEFDTASAFNATGSTVGTAPAYSFNPQVAGYYQINAATSNAVSGTSMRLTFFKNGSQYKICFDNLGSNTMNAVSGSTVVYCNGSTDYIQVYAYWGVGQAMSASNLQTWFNGCYLRGA